MSPKAELYVQYMVLSDGRSSCNVVQPLGELHYNVMRYITINQTFTYQSSA